MQTLEAAAHQLKGTVSDAMTEDVRVAQANLPVAEVARMMTEHKLRRIIVVDNNNRPLGVVSQRDLLKSYLSTEGKAPAEDDGQQRPLFSEPIHALITRNKLVSVPTDLPLIRAAIVLASNKIGCLPVVSENQELKGVISATDILQQITGSNEQIVESTFKFYTPTSDARTQLPAYIRKINGEIVIPMQCLKNQKAETSYALLGYDPPSGRILIKFLSEESKSEDAIRVNQTKDTLVIPASGFVSHFDLAGKASAFQVIDHKESTCLVLVPKQNS